MSHAGKRASKGQGATRSKSQSHETLRLEKGGKFESKEGSGKLLLVEKEITGRKRGSRDWTLAGGT